MTGWSEEEILDWPFERLARWLAYYELEPFGPVQEDLRAGQVASLIYSANRGKDSPHMGPADFFPSLKEPEEKTAERDRAEQVWRMRIWGFMNRRRREHKTA